MSSRAIVKNDVYGRHNIELIDFHPPITPSAHSDEMELFCAKQSLAVYATYPSLPHNPQHDYIPSLKSDAFAKGMVSLTEIIQTAGLATIPTDGTSQPEDDDPSAYGNSGYRSFVSDKAAALLVWKERHLVIAFRGTANWQDWIHNFTGASIFEDTVDVSYGNDLHKGFTGLAANIFPAVEELIWEFSRERRASSSQPISVTLCGHSLGGALALNIAAHFTDHRSPFYHAFLREGILVGATYTFGAPRIGKGEIWNVIRRPHYRLIVAGDPVPSSPPMFAADYQAAYLAKPEQKALQPETTLGKIKKAAKTLISPPLDFNAHNIEVYIEAIENKIRAKKDAMKNNAQPII